ncbi:hypothetical protein WN51_10785 [Melipona quadrifasciata]|uniref:Uncharacterized protein n=1 Tax=Melipona quadrifasciata TaxID=166423 RepID=A0A0M9A6M0_9HYME|nr:hypothetical protein WN51_10785 [Melipona quadrifasciata]
MPSDQMRNAAVFSSQCLVAISAALHPHRAKRREESERYENDKDIGGREEQSGGAATDNGDVIGTENKDEECDDNKEKTTTTNVEEATLPDNSAVSLSRGGEGGTAFGIPSVISVSSSGQKAALCVMAVAFSQYSRDLGPLAIEPIVHRCDTHDHTFKRQGNFAILRNKKAHVASDI